MNQAQHPELEIGSPGAQVRYVEDITTAKRVERELVLFKLRAPPGPQRTELLQLVDIFRAGVIDVSGAHLLLPIQVLRIGF